MANFCPKCGQEIQTGMSACPKCGAAITGAQVQNPPDGDVTKAKLGFINFVNALSIAMLVIFGIGLFYTLLETFLLILDWGLLDFLSERYYQSNIGVPLLGLCCGLYLLMKSSMQKKIYKATGKID